MKVKVNLETQIAIRNISKRFRMSSEELLYYLFIDNEIEVIDLLRDNGYLQEKV